MILILTSLCDYKISQTKFEKYLYSLPNSEQQKIQRYKKWQDSQLALFGRLLLKHGLSLLGDNRNGLVLEFTPYNKPFIKGGPHFNISHSGQYTVCAISTDQEIGIDVEHMLPINIEDFKTQWSHHELNEITISQDPLRLFYRYWTRKEAIIKADGRGLSLPLTQLDVTGTYAKVEKKRWFLSRIYVDDNYECHVASQKSSDEMHQTHLMF